MKTKTYKTIIGVDLGDKKHHVCVTNKDGNIVSETAISNNREQIVRLVKEQPGALVAIEVGTHTHVSVA